MPIIYFGKEQLFPLIISTLILIVSIIVSKRKPTLSIILLFFGTIGLGYFMANLDHFLNLWDEQFHALVAKHLLKNPLRPILYYEPLLDFDYKNWTANNIWLHKQPLFLWQMALSIKLLGTTEMAIRIPSIIMHAIIPLFIYRIGVIALNRRAAYYGAFLFAVAYFPLELITGRYPTDHNDIAFLFYVTASFWAWFEYKNSNKISWLILIGIFSGCAVLVKWLLGLLVYIIWGVTKLITEPANTFNIKSYLPLLFSGMISLVVFLPWQIYIRLAFPLESKFESELNTDHFFIPIEGHGGSFEYHFTDALDILYGSGDAVPYLLLVGIILMLFNISNNTYRFSIASSIIVVYLFFSIAATKMLAYTLIVSPFIYLGLGTIISLIILTIEKKIKYTILTNTVELMLIVVIAYFALNLEQIQYNHTKTNTNKDYRIAKIVEMDFINSLKASHLNKEYVIFNAKQTTNGNIPIMFYSDYLAYSFIPSQEQIEKIRENHKEIAVLDIGELPDYILNDNKIKILKLAY